MQLTTLLYEKSAQVAVLTLNRPERVNALDRTMLKEIQLVLDAVEADEQVRALVVTGAGNAFSSGFDLKEQMAAAPSGTAEWRKVLGDDFDAVTRFWSLAKPTIAAVRGPCLAGACELALACDITIASENAVFGEPELKFGAGIVVMMLPWITGPKQAKEIILNGIDNIGAREALRLGLINRVVAHDALMSTVREMATEIATHCSPRSIRIMKRQLYADQFNDLAASMAEADREMVASFSTADFREGVASFVERRPPRFPGK